MIDNVKMNAPEYCEVSEFSPACTTLHDAPIIEGVKKMIQNVLDALN